MSTNEIASCWAAAIAVAFGCRAIITAQTSGLDYTRWRGPERDGGASAFLEPTSWPTTLTRTWKVADSATWAQPAISGRRVFVKDVSSLALWTFE